MNALEAQLAQLGGFSIRPGHSLAPLPGAFLEVTQVQGATVLDLTHVDSPWPALTCTVLPGGKVASSRGRVPWMLPVHVQAIALVVIAARSDQGLAGEHALEFLRQHAEHASIRHLLGYTGTLSA